MYLVRLMWRSTSESKPVHSRYSRLSQAWSSAKPIRIISAVSNWFRRRTSHELDSAHVKYGVWTGPGRRHSVLQFQFLSFLKPRSEVPAAKLVTSDYKHNTTGPGFLFPLIIIHRDSTVQFCPVEFLLRWSHVRRSNSGSLFYLADGSAVKTVRRSLRDSSKEPLLFVI